MKTYKTAEQFEEEVARLQERSNRIVTKVNTVLMKKTEELYNQLNDDQKERVQRRFRAKQQEAIQKATKKIMEKPRIIHPGSFKVN